MNRTSSYSDTIVIVAVSFVVFAILIHAERRISVLADHTRGLCVRIANANIENSGFVTRGKFIAYCEGIAP